MGMYTELIFKACMKSNMPDDVKGVLEFLFNQGPRPSDDLLPKHLFFDEEARWSLIGRGCSFYHHPSAMSDINKEGGAWYIFSRSDLKNYYDQIELFIQWITPYVNESPGKCIGWSWYEEMELPTLLFMPIEEEISFVDCKVMGRSPSSGIMVTDKPTNGEE